MTTTAIKRLPGFLRSWYAPNSGAAATLAFFRVGFGLLMAVSLLRFAFKGWIYDLYIGPAVYFPFYGFEWIKPLPAALMYTLFALMIVLALLVALGWYYRLSVTLFFLSFTYVELIDKTNYLNHYYFISLVAFLLIFLPAHAAFSLDARAGRAKQPVRNYHYAALLLQVGSVYFFAGVAKIKADWLLEAQPLSIWLHARSDLPLIGPLLDLDISAYAASWAGMLFDLTVPFLLLWKRSRLPAYMVLVFFHIATGVLFHIGMFPYIMMFAALVFFPPEWHRKQLENIGFLHAPDPVPAAVAGRAPRVAWLLVPLFAFQFFMPFRYLLYPGDLFIGEEGFRFSWNVMLMEKNGMCGFRVRNPDTGRIHYVSPSDWLSRQQERMMSSQPDMILQFAHMLADYEKKTGNPGAEVYAECYVAVNGHGSRLLIDPNTNLANREDNFYHKEWILNHD